MFTGIITHRGRIEARCDRGAGGAVLRIEHPFAAGDLELGQSVAVDGACLTVARQGPGWFEADLSPETMGRTTLGQVPAGHRVNLERALAVGERLGGHWVQGHVDGQGRVVDLRAAGDGREIRIQAPPPLQPYLLEKGSVAVDGISLTVARREGDRFTVAVVPHTWDATTLPDRMPGDAVNLEADLLVRTVVATLERWAREGQPGDRLEQALQRGGYIDHPGR